MTKRNTTKDSKAQTAAQKRRLKLRKEVLRNLNEIDLNIVAGGIHCPASTPPPGNRTACC